MSGSENYIKLSNLLERARQLLRTTFLERWKETQGSDWTDCKASGEFFTSENGKRIYNSLKKSQKALENGNSFDWDLQILETILKDRIFLLPKEKKASIERIIKIRNEHAHHPTIETFTPQIFNLLWDRLEIELISLGDSKVEISKLKSMDIYSTQSKKQNEAALKLKTEGNEKFKENQFDEALKLYSEALYLSDLSSKERAILYLNCSICYFKIYENKKTANNLDESKNNQILEEALRNSNLSKDYAPTWFKPYFRIGLIYEEMKSYKKAVQYFENAKIFDPTNEDLNFHLADARKILGIEERREYLDPRMKPKTTEEHFQEGFTQMKGIDISHDKYLELKNLLLKDPIFADVCKGHEYRDGAKGIKQNYELAVQYYQKAADQGNPEGMYNLAMLIEQGKGAKKDFKKAFDLLERAASQAPTGSEIPKVGTVEAEHSLGLRYYEGIYVERSYIMAFYWYQRASQHGSGLSANNLGLMYMDGLGVSMNLEKAEKLLFFAHSKSDPNASINLVYLYLRNKDPERALLWHERSLAMGSLFSKGKDKEIRSLINLLIKEFDKSGIVEWEQEHGLSSTNLNQIQRKERLFEQAIGLTNISRMEEIMNLDAMKSNDTPRIDVKVVAEYANKGSQTAKIYLNALEAYGMALYVMDKDDDQFVDFLSQAYQIDTLVVQISIDLKPKMDAIINRVLNKTKGQVCKLNEDARICYVCLKGKNEVDLSIKFITDSLQLYPKCRTIIEIRGCLFNFIQKNNEGLADLNKAIDLEPENYGLVYLKAATLRLSEKNLEAIETYKEFLNKAPICDRKVPEAYYSIATRYRELQQLDQAKLYYFKGQEAEKDQLPFFLPYKSTSKELLTIFQQVEDLPNKMKSKSNPKEISEQKPTQLDPLRLRVLLSHRRFIYNTSIRPTPQNVIIQWTNPPTKRQKLASFAGLKPLYLREMDKSKDHLLTGVLTATNVDILCVGGPSVHFVIKDSNNDVIGMSVYNFEETYEELINTYKIGCEMQIINPYMRIPQDLEARIRVDDPRALKLTGKYIENMCRYCFKGNAKFKCTKCKALYCSKQCQEDDWKDLNHKKICFSFKELFFFFFFFFFFFHKNLFLIHFYFLEINFRVKHWPKVC